MAGPRTLQSTIFRAFALFVLIILLLVFFLFVLSTRRLLLRQAIDSSVALSEAIGRDIDREIGTMDMISINIAYSELVRGSFVRYLENSGERRLEGRRTLADVVTAIVGPNLPVKQVFLYDLNGSRIGIGMLNFTSTVDVMSQSWFAAVIDADGRKVLCGPEESETLANAYVIEEGQLNIALRRLFFDRYRNSVGVMELLQDTEDVFAAAIEFERTQEGALFVVDADGTLIYPSLPVEEAESVAGETDDEDRRPTFPESVVGAATADSRSGTITGRPGMVAAFARSEVTDWTTVLTLERRVLLAEANRIALQLAILIVPILLAVLGVSYVVSRRVSRPLGALHSTISNIEFESIGEDPEIAPLQFNELEEVGQAVSRMARKLKASVAEVLAAHEHEASARMQALQSQANPHFLHNTINTITAMAEEGRTDQIVRLSGNLSAMMRYLADRQVEVTLKEELDYTRRYLDCMCIRFESQLRYDFDVIGDPMQVRGPRLMVQPLVENAIKHGTTRRGPWEVQITARVTETGWTVDVVDNGPGFSMEVLREIDAVRRSDDAAPPAGGIGLTSILLRLRLMYESRAIFEVANRATGGATVRIGVKDEGAEP